MGTLHSNGSLGMKWSINGVTCSAFGNYAMQSGDVEDTGEEYTVKDAAGNTVIWYGYDHKRMANFEYIVTAASATITASITAPSFGTFLTVTDSVLSTNPLTGSYIAVSSTVKETNKEAAVVTVKAVQYDAITS